MKRTKDKEINRILARAEEYRKQYNKKFNIEENVNFDIAPDIIDIFKAFFGTQPNNIYNNENNIFINCKLNKTEAKNGCKKIIKYKLKEKNNKQTFKKIEVKIPSDIKEEQKIIIHGCGNYIKEKDKYSDLVINILVKGCRRKRKKYIYYR